MIVATKGYTFSLEGETTDYIRLHETSIPRLIYRELYHRWETFIDPVLHWKIWERMPWGQSADGHWGQELCVNMSWKCEKLAGKNLLLIDLTEEQAAKLRD